VWRRLETGAPWSELGAEFQTTPSGAKRRFQRALRRVQRALLRAADRLSEPERRVVLARFGAPADGHSADAPSRPEVGT
jgi:hypothetical protein